MEKKITSYKEDITTLVIFAEIPSKEYANSWLALSNNKRDHKEFLELRNYYDSNTIKVVIDITEESNKEEAKQHYINFLEAWSCEIDTVSIKEAVKYTVCGYELDYEDKDIYLIGEDI